MEELTDFGVVRVEDVDLTVGDYPKLVNLYNQALEKRRDVIEYNSNKFFTKDIGKLIHSCTTI